MSQKGDGFDFMKNTAICAICVAPWRRLMCRALYVPILIGAFFCLPVQAQDAAEDEDQAEQQSSRDDSRSVRRLSDMMGGDGGDFSMDIPEMPVSAMADQPEVVLPNAALNDRLQQILNRRAFAPNDPQIEAELSALLAEAEAETIRALEAEDLGLAEANVRALSALEFESPVMAQVEAERARLNEIQRLLSLADQARETGNLLDPEEASARALYAQVLELDPENLAASAGLGEVDELLLARLEELVVESNLDLAEELLDRLAALGIAPEALQRRRGEIAEARQDLQRQAIARARSAIDNNRFDAAERQIDDLIAMGAPAAQVANLRASLDDARRYGGFEPGQMFQDSLPEPGGLGPVMVVIPAGSFQMGSPEDEQQRLANEGPQHRVVFEAGFALARHETTVGQFRRFVLATGYVTDAEREGSSRIYLAGTGRVTERRRITWEDDYMGNTADDDLPVIHVSWNDANAYAEWLARQSDRGYRLPSEAEFEYALRAGSQTPYWWGDGSPDRAVENMTGDQDRFPGDQRRWDDGFRRYSDGFWGPAPVASLEANPFGLFDMGGNVMEWVEDCWHDSFIRAPSDGSAWVNPGCNRRVIRGASWSSNPAMSRSAFRLSSRSEATDARVGFRVARDL